MGQGPIAPAVGAGGGCLDIFFSRLSLLFSFSLSLGDGPIKTGILSQRDNSPNTDQTWPDRISNLYNLTPTNQPTYPTHWRLWERLVGWFV